MAEKLIPTFGLRFIIRQFPVPGLGPEISQGRPVLQQRFETPNGKAVWRDVPTTDEKEAKHG